MGSKARPPSPSLTQAPRTGSCLLIFALSTGSCQGPEVAQCGPYAYISAVAGDGAASLESSAVTSDGRCPQPACTSTTTEPCTAWTVSMPSSDGATCTITFRFVRSGTELHETKAVFTATTTDHGVCLAWICGGAASAQLNPYACGDIEISR
jgi:hypothetical protein